MTEHALPGDHPRRRGRKVVVRTDFRGRDERYLATVDTADPEPELPARLQEAIDSQTDYRQQVLKLRGDGHSYKAIANWLNTTEGAVRVAAFRARQAIKSQFPDLAPVIIFILVLALILALSGVAKQLPPVRPIPILPRSQSGLYVQPEDAPRPCTISPVRSSDSPPLAAPPQRPIVRIAPAVLVRADDGRFIISLRVANRSAQPLTLQIESILVALYKPGSVLPLGGTYIAGGVVQLRPGGTHNFTIEVWGETCRNGGPVILPRTSPYLAQATITWTHGQHSFDWLLPKAAVHLVAHPPTPVRTVRAMQCTSHRDGTLFFAIFSGFVFHPVTQRTSISVDYNPIGFEFDVAGDPLFRRPDESIVRITLSIKNTLSRAQTIYLSDGMVSLTSSESGSSPLNILPGASVDIAALASTRCAGKRPEATYYSVDYRTDF